MVAPDHDVATDLRRQAESLGFGLIGIIDAARYDATLPVAQAGRRASVRFADAGTLVILGSGGRDFWNAMQVTRPTELPRPDYHPIDEASRQGCRSLVDWLAARSVRSSFALPDEEDALDFLRLASMSGIGAISPVIGLLLHEEFGPWVSLRGVLLIEGRPFGEIPSNPSSFDPCAGCDQPCVSACPVSVFDGAGGAELGRCATQRLGGGCSSGCDARRACPVGAGARYGPDEEAFRHAYSLFAMQRWSAGDPEA